MAGNEQHEDKRHSPLQHLHAQQRQCKNSHPIPTSSDPTAAPDLQHPVTDLTRFVARIPIQLSEVWLARSTQLKGLLGTQRCTLIPWKQQRPHVLSRAAAWRLAATSSENASTAAENAQNHRKRCHFSP